MQKTIFLFVFSVGFSGCWEICLFTMLHGDVDFINWGVGVWCIVDSLESRWTSFRKRLGNSAGVGVGGLSHINE